MIFNVLTFDLMLLWTTGVGVGWRMFFLESNQGSVIHLCNGVLRAGQTYGSPKVALLEFGCNSDC